MPDRQHKLLKWACFGLSGLIFFSIFVLPTIGRASNPADLCAQAAQHAALRHAVPLDVLQTIALVETGRKTAGRMQPWPWAIHADGQGQWFNNRDAALDRARASLNAGRRNVDLGCFQINYHWHGHHFHSLEEMIDPNRNADYAARLLAGHKARLGSWELAAGAYHSATPEFAERYRARFLQLRQFAHVAPLDAAFQSLPEPSRNNRFALLVPAGAGRMGSLVGFDARPVGPRLIDGGRDLR